MFTLKPRHTLPPYTLRGWSILAPALFDPAHSIPARVARIEKGQEPRAALLAAAPALANSLATLCATYTYGTPSELAQAIHAAETLLSGLDHPSTIPGGPINPAAILEKRPPGY